MSDCQKKVCNPQPPHIFVYFHLDITKKLGHDNARKTAQEKHRFIEHFFMFLFAEINPRIDQRLQHKQKQKTLSDLFLYQIETIF